MTMWIDGRVKMKDEWERSARGTDWCTDGEEIAQLTGTSVLNLADCCHFGYCMSATGRYTGKVPRGCEGDQAIRRVGSVIERKDVHSGCNPGTKAGRAPDTERSAEACQLNGIFVAGSSRL